MDIHALDHPTRKPARAMLRFAIGSLAISVGLMLSAVPAGAEDSTLSKDAKQVGHAIGNAAHEIGHTAKEAGVQVGHDAAKAAKEIGPAAKEAGSEIGSGFSDFGHRIGHAAKEAWDGFVGLFHSKN